MQAIEQLVQYFRARGALAEEQLDYLRTRGFIGWDHEGCEAYGPEYEEWDSGGMWQEEIEGPLEARRQRRSGQGARGPDGCVLRATEICARLARRVKDWEPSLSGLVGVANRIAKCTTWEQAAVIVRQSGSEALYEGLAEGLQRRSPPLSSLWNMLGLDGYHAVVEPGSRGPAVVAYRAVLAARDTAHVSKYSWILKQASVRQVFNLIQAQHRLLRICGWLYSRDPQRISDALRRDPHELAYWAMVLLYNASKTGGARAPGAGFREYGPLTKRPDPRLWRQAWAQALVMDPVGAIALLESWMASAPDGKLRALAKSPLSDLGRTRECLPADSKAQKLWKKPLASLPWTARVALAFRRLNLRTIGQLASKTENDLLACKNFGVTSLNEVKGMLSRFDLTLGMKMPPSAQDPALDAMKLDLMCPCGWRPK